MADDLNALQLNARHEILLARIKALFDLASIALRGIILANGGAAIALLAFLGHVWTDPTRAQKLVAQGLDSALLTFALGVFASIFAAGVGYVCQLFYTAYMKEPGDRASKWGDRLRVGTIGTAFIGIVCFLVGTWVSISAFRAGAS